MRLINQSLSLIKSEGTAIITFEHVRLEKPNSVNLKWLKKKVLFSAQLEACPRNLEVIATYLNSKPYRFRLKSKPPYKYCYKRRRVKTGVPYTNPYQK